jgi:hypothetical protein
MQSRNFSRLQIAYSKDSEFMTAIIHHDQRGTLLQVFHFGVLRAGAPLTMLWSTRVLVTLSEATVERWIGAIRTTRRSRRSGQAEERAQPAEDRERIRANNVYPEYWLSTHLSDDGGDTQRASGHCMCDLHMHIYRYDRAEVVLTRFRSIRFQSYAVELQIQAANTWIGNVSCRIQL